MPRARPKTITRESLAARVQQNAAIDDLTPGTDEYSVVDWLTRLHLLQGVPFSYLVPDIRMLPTESIRFFQLDITWIEALTDGAFGIASAKATQPAGVAVRGLARAAVSSRLGSVRATALGSRSAPLAASAPGPVSGFLLRSAVVSGWPTLEVRCWGDAAQTLPVPLLRLEQLAPSVLLCLAGPGVIAAVELQEPSEGVHFGVDPQDVQTMGAPWVKRLRYAGDGGTSTPIGGPIPGADGAQAAVPVPLRDPTTLVLRVDSLARAMSTQVWPPDAGQGPFTAAEFGLEMVEGVEAVTFAVGEGS